MKRFSAVVLALVVTVAFAVPASAYQVKIGARVDIDVGYIFQTGTSYLGFGINDSRQPDLTTFYIGMPVTNYLRVDWTSNDKSTGARIELGIFAGGPGFGHGGSGVVLRHMYGWYKFGRCKLVIGQTDNLLASLAYAPYQWLGLGAIFSFASGVGPAAGVILLGAAPPVVMFIGQGKQYSGRFAQIALYYYVGPWTFMVALGQASTFNAGFAALAPVLFGVAGVSNTMFPRLDLVVKYKGKYIGVAPGFSIYMSELEPIEGGTFQDDRILSYLLVLPFRLSFGAFRVKGEVSHGRNWDTFTFFAMQRALNWATYWGGNNDATRTKIEDTYFLAACLGLEYHLGRVSFHLGGGWQKTTNAGNDQFGTWRHGQNVRYAFNFAVRYRVNRHFVIAPEISYWYYGWNPFLDVGDRNAMNADYGSAWLVGISFQIRF